MCECETESVCKKRDGVTQLMFPTVGQGSAHGRATKVDKHTHINTLLQRTRRNPHDQSGRPGDTQSVGDEEMDMVGVGGGGRETQRPREGECVERKEVHETEGWGENEDQEKGHTTADLVLRWTDKMIVKSRRLN